MNRTEIIERVAEETDTSKASAERCVTAFLNLIQHAVAQGETVTLSGFGKFESYRRSGRKIRDLSSGKYINLSSVTRPRFVAGSAFKELVASSIPVNEEEQAAQ